MNDSRDATQQRIPIPIGTLVDRFLAWKLPENFHPDAGISFQPYFNVEWNAKHGKPPQRHEPIGTNLLTADQARAMLEHVLAPMMGAQPMPKRAHCCRLMEDVPQKCPDCPSVAPSTAAVGSAKYPGQEIYPAMNAAHGSGQLAEWVRERLDNCHRLAAMKSGDDRAGWLEDASYFSAILEVLTRVPSSIRRRSMGSGTDKRNRALAIRCANLRSEGHTFRTIAEIVGKKPEQIKALVALGERVRELNPTRPDDEADWSPL